MSSLGIIVHFEVDDTLEDDAYRVLKMRIADVTLQQVQAGLERLSLASTDVAITAFAMTEGVGLGVNLLPASEMFPRQMVATPSGPQPAPTDDELRHARREFGSFPAGEEVPRVEG